MRTAAIDRVTNETSVSVSVSIDGSGSTRISTGLPFFDHMLDQIGRHSGMDLEVTVAGDLAVDGHHTIEDTALVLGEAIRVALGDKVGVRRFASGRFPLDEALIDVAIDLSGRSYLHYEVPFGEVLPLGDPPFNPEMAAHFFRSFVDTAQMTVHLTLVRGSNTHHVIEAAFKGFARCLRDAVRVESTQLPTTKGAL